MESGPDVLLLPAAEPAQPARKPGTWAKGQSGNPRGRTPGVFTSLAEEIKRSSLVDDRMPRLLAVMWDMALLPHDDARVRILACEWIARHGWPDELKGTTTVTTDGKVTTVTHVHQP